MMKRSRNWRRLGNWLLSLRPTINLWVDDERPAPRGWYWAITAAEAMHVLSHHTVVHASFDHDLGSGSTGYDLVLYLAEFLDGQEINYWPKNKPTVHSANPPGKANMESVIDHYGPYKGETT